MKKKHLLWFPIYILFLVSCGTQQEYGQSDGGNNDLPEMIKVEIQTSPDEEQIQPNESFTLSAKVTQGDESVNDADEVLFEFWQEGDPDEKHEMTQGEFQADGVYSIEKTVQEAGVYNVIAHVTARDMHNMPQKQFIIGDVEGSKHIDDDGNKERAHEEHLHQTEVKIDIIVDGEIKQNEEVMLITYIEKDDGPVTEANVTFELWKEGAEKHDYIPAKETHDGEYSLNHTFAHSGEHHIKIHFEKGDLHEHSQESVFVK
ncbi:FixH family protein [Salirhabdus salicampi]|uniref:FixH family protein n=1 Tax=Salirhabdus salicampi TaxID=476102 RepID=UPI0020C51829|nr:FixH family protein [Salirhabdus salicampi]MCP8615364.1 FixH family protein [Salirhabdus salicampi]